MNKQLKKISDNVYSIRYGGDKSAVVTFGEDASQVVDAIDQDKTRTYGGRGDHVMRGKDDAVLLRLHKLACDSPNKWMLIQTRADFLYGLGLGVGREEVKDQDIIIKPVIDPTYKAWIKRLRLNDYLMNAAAQSSFANEVYVRLNLNLNKQVESLEVVDCFEIRAKKPAKGQTAISHYLINPNFGTKQYRQAENVEVPVFDPADPTKYPTAIIHVRRAMAGQKIYSFAPWWGTERWTEVSNKIPVFNNAGLDNGFFVTHHVSIPDNYFVKQGLTEDEQEKLKVRTLDEIGDTLTGYENGSKILFTFHGLDGQGKELEGVKINALKFNINDEAFVQLFNAANATQAAGHGFLPVLAGIETGGKMGSGKEVESAANYTQDFLTNVDRELLLMPIQIARDIDAKPCNLDVSLDFMIKRIRTYTYDVTGKNHPANPNSQSDAN